MFAVLKIPQRTFSVIIEMRQIRVEFAIAPEVPSATTLHANETLQRSQSFVLKAEPLKFYFAF